MASNLFHSGHIPSLLIIQHYNIRSDQYMATFFVSPYETTAVEINDCQPLWKSVLSVDIFALNAKISTRTVQQEHVRVHTHLLYWLYSDKTYLWSIYNAWSLEFNFLSHFLWPRLMCTPCGCTLVTRLSGVNPTSVFIAACHFPGYWFYKRRASKYIFSAFCEGLVNLFNPEIYGCTNIKTSI